MPRVTNVAHAANVSMRALLLALAFALVASACGETRHGPGEACLRGDDCLSGFCTDRICVAAPPLGKPQNGSNTDGGDTGDDGGGSTDSGAADARGD